MKKLTVLFILIFSLFLFCCKDKEKKETPEVKEYVVSDTILDYEVTDELDIDGLFRVKDVASPKENKLNVKRYHYFDKSYKIVSRPILKCIIRDITFVLDDSEKDINDENILNNILNGKYKIAVYDLHEIIFTFEEKYYYAYRNENNLVYDDSCLRIVGIWELEKVSSEIIYIDNYSAEYLDIDKMDYFVIDRRNGLIIFPDSIVEDNFVKVPVLSKYVFSTYDNKNDEYKIYATIQTTPYGITTYCINLLVNTKYMIHHIKCDFTFSFSNRTSEKINKSQCFLIASSYIDYNPPKDFENPYLDIIYYGTYKDGYCVYVVPNYGSIKRNYRTTTIAGYEFIYEWNLELMYIKDNKVLTLKEAYSKNLLDKNDIRLIWEVNDRYETPETLKPIIYLYPTEDIDLVIKFKDPSRLLTTYPKYDDGWNVHVSKDSNITIGGRTYYGLFFDEVSNYEPDFSEGFFVTKDNAISFLEESLDKMGFTEREACEFIMFWLPVLENNEMSLVYFEQTKERNEECPLELSVDFDTYLRVIIHIKKVNEVIDIKEQVLERVNRIGSCLVEWGGSNR